ncbi:MAG: 6-phosphogluconolactonase [Aestuariivita sp.]|nr:6-phosphogluconolactonase [Aestuariivita sp.]MCY4347102.1 6-phosphogluconolactonase [Aestuariivita sp.]
MDLIEYKNRDTLFEGLADLIQQTLANFLEQAPTISIAVPGGTTPAPLFERLSRSDLDWSRVYVCLTDERCVPADHERSNFRLIKQHLGKNNAVNARFVKYHRGGSNPADCLKEGIKALSAAIPLDIALIGMGTDGHVASMFPNAEGLVKAFAPDAELLIEQSPPNMPENRITLPAHLLNSARMKHLLITGEEKKQTLLSAQMVSKFEMPVNAILAQTKVHWSA